MIARGYLYIRLFANEGNIDKVFRLFRVAILALSADRFWEEKNDLIKFSFSVFANIKIFTTRRNQEEIRHIKRHTIYKVLHAIVRSNDIIRNVKFLFESGRYTFFSCRQSVIMNLYSNFFLRFTIER